MDISATAIGRTYSQLAEEVKADKARAAGFRVYARHLDRVRQGLVGPDSCVLRRFRLPCDICDPLADPARLTRP